MIANFLNHLGRPFGAAPFKRNVAQLRKACGLGATDIAHLPPWPGEVCRVYISLHLGPGYGWQEADWVGYSRQLVALVEGQPGSDSLRNANDIKLTAAAYGPSRRMDISHFSVWDAPIGGTQLLPLFQLAVQHRLHRLHPGDTIQFATSGIRLDSSISSFLMTQLNTKRRASNQPSTTKGNR